MYRQKLYFLALSATSAAVMLLSCRPAQYEIIRGQTGGSPGDPSAPFVNPGTTPPPTMNTPVVPNNMPPTARIEVIWNNEPVTRVKINENVEIRPSLDTVDPDDVGVVSCVNPGIIKAEYDIGMGGDKRIAERQRGCEPLGVPYRFTTPGSYEISLIVTSNENETAWATMTVLVFDGNTPPANQGGFTIQAHPLLVGIGEAVNFWGTCTLGQTQVINWQFGDGGTATGPVVTHVYQSIGQYRVDAVCTDETGNSQNAQLTVVVIDKTGVKIPGFIDPIIPQPAPIPAPTPPPAKDAPPPAPSKKPGWPWPFPQKQPGKSGWFPW